MILILPCTDIIAGEDLFVGQPLRAPVPCIIDDQGTPADLVVNGPCYVRGSLDPWKAAPVGRRPERSC